MRVVVQRCSRAEVRIDGNSVGKIGQGFMLLVGITETDTTAEADLLAKKIAQLRVFEDEAGKMNLAIRDVEGAILSISQFTLLGDVRHGKRPSWIRAERPEKANEMYARFNDALRAKGIHVEEGVFQAEMLVNINNDGPVTILLDSKRTF